MKIFLSVLLAFILGVAKAQGFERKADLEGILNSLSCQGIIGGKVSDNPTRITSYQFDGDYSSERVFPNTPATATICVTPITFESPIHRTLQQIDASYDSTFYQKQIHDILSTQWTKLRLELTAKIRFIKSGFMKSEIGIISYPLFSKDGETATMMYGTISGNSTVKQREKVYFLKRNGNEWSIIATIDSKNTW